MVGSLLLCQEARPIFAQFGFLEVIFMGKPELVSPCPPALAAGQPRQCTLQTPMAHWGPLALPLSASSALHTSPIRPSLDMSDCCHQAWAGHCGPHPPLQGEGLAQAALAVSLALTLQVVSGYSLPPCPVPCLSHSTPACQSSTV